MKMNFKRKMTLLVVFLLVFSSLSAQGNYVAKILTDGEGTFLEGENLDLKHPLASLTKMMTVVVALDEVKQGRVNLDDTVRVSKEASRVGGSKAKLRWGEKISLDDLIQAVIVYSGNDAAHAIAEYIAGTEEEFVKKMNEKAEELGLENTLFHTSTGLPTNMTNKEMDVSTVKDMAKLSSEILNNYDVYMEYSKKEKITIGDKFVKSFENRNNLIGKFEGVNGLKTGHHSAAGYNLAITAVRDEREFIVIVFGFPTEKERDIEVERTLDMAFKNYKKRKIASKNEFAMKVEVKNAIEKKIDLFVKRDVYGLINTSEDWDFKKIAYVPEEVKSPIEAGQTIGLLTIKYKDRVVDEVELITNKEIDEIPWYWKIIRVVTFNIL